MVTRIATAVRPNSAEFLGVTAGTGWDTAVGWRDMVIRVPLQGLKVLELARNTQPFAGFQRVLDWNTVDPPQSPERNPVAPCDPDQRLA